jgi:hypothetical protein
MEQTANLKLPYIMPSQAQPNVTHNEALRMLDAFVQLAVLDRDLASPPASPAEGSRYIVAVDATDDWAGHEDEISAWQDGAWVFHTPRAGWLAWLNDEERLVGFNGAEWVEPSPSMMGINAAADETNRLALASSASLFSHQGGDHRLKINKNAAGDTASVLFQTGFSGRAEMGLAGDDDYCFKVSPDGAAWHEAITIDRNTGRVSLPNTAQPRFETDYVADSQSVDHATHTVVSEPVLGLDELGDSTYEDGVWTIGAADAGLWLIAAFCQFNSATRALLTFERYRDSESAWDVVMRVQDEGEIAISRTVALSPLVFLSQGDMFRFQVYHVNLGAASNALRLFTASGRRIG